MPADRKFACICKLFLPQWRKLGGVCDILGIAVVLCACLGAFFVHPVSASPVARLCDRAAAKASRAEGVPLDVLRAISLTETGRASDNGLQPWPWTVNMEGEGHWFASEDAARAYVYSNFKRGARSFDVGCFQINYRWHGKAFRSIDEMFDPYLNAQYAARFLRDLFEEHRDWSRAAGAYHSRTPGFARTYTARFDRIRATLSGGSAPDPFRQSSPLPRDLTDSTGRQPLFTVGQSSSASLVPAVFSGSTPSAAFIPLN